MAEKKYVAGRGFNTGAGNYYDWSQNTDNSVQGNTFLFLGGGGAGSGKDKSGKPKKVKGGTYGYERFWRGRSELSGIGAAQDWRSMQRPAIREGSGPMKPLLGTGPKARGRAKRAGGAVMRRISSRGSQQPGGGSPAINQVAGTAHDPQGAAAPGTQFDHVAFAEANAPYLRHGAIQGPSGMSPTGISAYPMPQRGSGGPVPWSRRAAGDDVSFT